MLQQQNPSLLPPSSPEDLSLKPAYIQRLRSRSVDVSRSRSVDISRSRSVDISQSRNVGADTRHLQQIYIQSSLNTPLSPWSSSPTAPRRPQLKRSHSFWNYHYYIISTEYFVQITGFGQQHFIQSMDWIHGSIILNFSHFNYSIVGFSWICQILNLVSKKSIIRDSRNQLHSWHVNRPLFLTNHFESGKSVHW